MGEAVQSKERRDVYIKQLMFEKIYSLGSHPAAAVLAARHNIRWITGIEGSSAGALAHNPALNEVIRGGDIVLYEIANTPNNPPDTIEWLLRPSTLVNDIGDREDTFAHLPASLQTSRLSSPQYDGTSTYRISTASIIPLVFNAHNYVSILWDQDENGTVDTNLELYIETVFGPASLTVRLPDSSEVTVIPGQPVRINPNSLIPTEKNLLKIQILNSTQEPIAINLIALGLARVP